MIRQGETTERFPQATASYQPSLEAQVLLDIYNNETSARQSLDSHAFFEHIMVTAPDWMGNDFTQPPPDLSTWMPDVDMLEQADLFESNFTPILDQTFQTQSRNYDVHTTPSTVGSGISAERRDEDDSRRRHAAFKQSPW